MLRNKDVFGTLAALVTHRSSDPPNCVNSSRALPAVQAMRVMEERNIRHLPVYDGEELMGMLSIKDIVGTFMDQHASDVNSMSDYIAGGSY